MNNLKPIKAVIDSKGQDIPAGWRSYKINLSYMQDACRVYAEFKVHAEKITEAWRLAKIMTDHKVYASAVVRKA